LPGSAPGAATGFPGGRPDGPARFGGGRQEIGDGEQSQEQHEHDDRDDVHGTPPVLVRPRSSVFLMIGCLPPSMTV
jgi:hypothetical protein